MENGRLPLSYGGMGMGWMVLGGICLLYFLLLLGVGMDFSVIWLLAGAGSVMVGLFRHFGKWKLPKTYAVHQISSGKSHIKPLSSALLPYFERGNSRKMPCPPSSIFLTISAIAVRYQMAELSEARQTKALPLS